MATKVPDNWADKNAEFVGHDEGSNRPPNVGNNVFMNSGSTFAPLDQSGSNGLNQKTGFGTNGKAEGQE